MLAMIVHQRRQTPWLVIAALLAGQFERRVRSEPPSLEQLHS
jgi:hypothetical protein